MRGSTDNILNRELECFVVERPTLQAWLHLGQTAWDMDGFMLPCATGSLRKYPKVLHFILGQMNQHKPRASPTVSDLPDL